MIDIITSRAFYLATFLLLGIGTYMMIASANLVKKVIGMNVFQTGIFLFFIAAAYVDGASNPVVHGGGHGEYVSPLPHVLILTAIVVGVSLTAVALGLIVRIYDEYGTLETDVLAEVRADE